MPLSFIFVFSNLIFQDLGFFVFRFLEGNLCLGLVISCFWGDFLAKSRSWFAGWFLNHFAWDLSKRNFINYIDTDYLRISCWYINVSHDCCRPQNGDLASRISIHTSLSLNSARSNGTCTVLRIIEKHRVCSHSVSWWARHVAEWLWVWGRRRSF